MKLAVALGASFSNSSRTMSPLRGCELDAGQVVGLGLGLADFLFFGPEFLIFVDRFEIVLGDLAESLVLAAFVSHSLARSNSSLPKAAMPA